MYDYWKLWIENKTQINTILTNPKLKKCFVVSESGELLITKGEYKSWEFETLPENKRFPYRLQITGSIHKYWNGGTNENTFNYYDAVQAIQAFCKEFDLNPKEAKLINLEFGLNLHPLIDASHLISEIICYNYQLPMRPYENKPNYYFIEFEQYDYYIKIYDKGKQYREQIKGLINTLRVEVKARNNRFLKEMGVNTVEDLLHLDSMQRLGAKIILLMHGLVFDDSSIIAKKLPVKDRQLYRELSNIKNWKGLKGNITATVNKKVIRFKEVVNQHGSKHIYSLINGLIKDKVTELTREAKRAVFKPNYTMKTDNNRSCLTCGKDISLQHPLSKYCSAKYVGEKEAHKCRNSSSNPRNNHKRSLAIEQQKKGLRLFDITPYIIYKKAN